VQLKYFSCLSFYSSSKKADAGTKKGFRRPSIDLRGRGRVESCGNLFINIFADIRKRNNKLQIALAITSIGFGEELLVRKENYQKNGVSKGKSYSETRKERGEKS
jgi:hypothetical protein